MSKPREYQQEHHVNSSRRLCKCGHYTNIGRYFKCEICVPALEADTDWEYFGCEATDEIEGE